MKSVITSVVLGLVISLTLIGCIDKRLSGPQLTRGMIESVGRALRETGLEARWLGLEITETALVNHQ